MLITAAEPRHLDAWLSLAREMEPLFGEVMADDPCFRDYVTECTKSAEALVALDRTHDDALMGAIAFSRSKNAISWLAVASGYRRRSVGSRLVEATLKQLDATADITVITFTGEDRTALAARSLYEKYGFAVTAASFMHHGHRRCLMTKRALPAANAGESFH